MSASAARAVGYLRRRTVGRAVRGYLDWIGKAVGWASVVYLIVWFVIFLVSGIQLLAPLTDPLPTRYLPLAANALLATFLLLPFFRAHAPPVILSRADLYRLALAPAAPGESLRWAFRLKSLLYALSGLVLGACWTLLAATWLATRAPLAGPLLALLAPAQLGLAWLAYAGAGSAAESKPEFEPESKQSRRVTLLLIGLILALCALDALAPGWGLAAALHTPNPLTLIQPAALLALVLWGVRASLRDAFPPAFPAQCLVLSELRAMSTLAFLGAGAADPARRAELLAQLRDKPTRATNRRLRPPPAAWGALGATSWRSALSLLRRPLLSHAFLLLLLAGSSFGVLSRAVGLVGVLFAALALGQSLVRLVGPAAPALPLPLAPADEALGRALPGGLVAAGVVTLVLTLISVVGSSGLGASVVGTTVSGVVTGSALLLAATQPLLGLLLLAKFSSWTGLPAERFEMWFVAALLALSPALLLAPLGLGLALLTQLGLLWLLAVLPF